MGAPYARAGPRAVGLDPVTMRLQTVAVAIQRSDHVGDRVDRRRARVVEEALDHALDVMGECGAGGLTVSEVARRMGMRAPSLYKYFPNLHGLYDALFARGYAANGEAVGAAIDGRQPGWDQVQAGVRATVRWCVENPALAQLLYWRPVPGFQPSAATFAESVDQMELLRQALAAAVVRGELGAGAAAEPGVRLLTVLISGLVSQQMANDPAGRFDTGLFAGLTDTALAMFAAHHPAPS